VPRTTTDRRYDHQMVMADNRSSALARSQRAKLIRYTGVSVIATLVSQAMLFALVDGAGLDGAPANVITVLCTSILSYLLNRAWVWGHRDAHSLRRELLPYWGMSALGLIVSTVLAWLAYEHLAEAGWAVSLANMAGFAMIWGIKYVVLDRIVFHPERRRPAGPAKEIQTR
jgi:putative flippase GtrA